MTGPAASPSKALMCGIAGLLAPGLPAAALLDRARAMAAALAHRGPDSRGIWTDAAAGLALAHTRLAILDLTPAGAQPMVSACGRFAIVYNGEAYNDAELRAALPGVNWRGRSDTETILEACARWGVEETAQRLNAMAAFALWDAAERRLWLVRDRIGIKPLYYGIFSNLFVFSSEIKALYAVPEWKPELDPAARAAFLCWGYVPAPRAIWRGIAKLEPGTILSVRAGDSPRLTRYWDARAVALAGLAAPIRATEAEAAERLEALLADAVRRQCVADVPLGAFLSGGVDSSAVVALMGNGRVPRSFTIGFTSAAHDEAPHAAAVARHLGTEHTAMTVGEAEALAVVPRLADIYDEPFADSSAVPTAVLCRLTRGAVTVALSGDGGDELFAGYTRYAQALAIWRRLARLPAPARRAAASLLRRLPARLGDALGRLVPGRRAVAAAGHRLNRLGAALADGTFAGLYREMVALWPDPPLREPVAAAEPPTPPPGLTPLEHMRLFDLLAYLPDDILTKVDRASMAVGLEVRVPLLDHRVVEFAWSLPPALNGVDGGGKRLLRRLLHARLPPALVERPKRGFAPPIAAWLRGPLREWAEDLLAPAHLATGGLDPRPIRTLWTRHLAGAVDEHSRLWAVLMHEAWRRRWASAPRATPG